MKSYLKDEVEFLSGLGVVYTEFIGEIAVRQVNILAGEYFASSSLHDRSDSIGYLLYDGKKNELDISSAIEIGGEEFEEQWSIALSKQVVKNNIIYRQGDATEPQIYPVVIVHIVNNIGKWGKGFVIALSKKYPSCRKRYLELYKSGEPPVLGDIQVIDVSDGKGIFIGNMFAQDGIKKSHKDNKRYVSYESLSDCLSKLADFCLVNRILSVQMPMIGTGLGGGDWNQIEKIIQNELCYKKIECYVIKFDQTQ